MSHFLSWPLVLLASLLSSLILSLGVCMRVVASVTITPFLPCFVFLSSSHFSPLVFVNVACSFEGLELVTNQLKRSGIEPNDFSSMYQLLGFHIIPPASVDRPAFCSVGEPRAWYCMQGTNATSSCAQQDTDQLPSAGGAGNCMGLREL